MSRALIRLSQAAKVLESDNGSGAFVFHFNQLARANKQWGARDRRELKDICYAYFRLGSLTKGFSSVYQALPFAVYLYLPHFQEWIAEYKEKELLPVWFALECDFTERLNSIKQVINLVHGPFPCASSISPQLEWCALTESLAHPASLWFRARVQKESELIQILKSNDIPYQKKDNAFGLPLGSNLATILRPTIASWGEIQDIASQQVVRDLDWNDKNIWDCCAASGGKSIQIMQEFRPRNLFCSDVRPAIIENLKERFLNAGLKIPITSVVDLLQFQSIEMDEGFDVILCDAPCSGSGVFRRNPESMPEFNKSVLRNYADKQVQITKNVIPFLKKGAVYVYSTCSVYALENENHRSDFEKMGLKFMQENYFNYLDCGGDVLYRAVYEKM